MRAVFLTVCLQGDRLVTRTLVVMADLYPRHHAVIPNWVALYYDQPIELTGGKGCRVTDANGKSYLDFFAGILTNMLGYDVAEVRESVERQLATGVVHTSTLYLIRHQVELAEKIARLSGIPDAKVFFTNSGTEANETALLLATTARGAVPVRCALPARRRPGPAGLRRDVRRRLHRRLRSRPEERPRHRGPPGRCGRADRRAGSGCRRLHH